LSQAALTAGRRTLSTGRTLVNFDTNYYTVTIEGQAAALDIVTATPTLVG